MKKVLLLSFWAFLFGAARTNAQCTVSGLTIEVISFNNSTCEVNFRLSWEQEVNNGNKFAYIHLWKDAAYHTPSGLWTNMYSNPSSRPNAAALANALLTISIFDNGTSTPTIGTTYPPDGSVTPLSSGLAVAKTSVSPTRERVTISNISITIPGGCSGANPLRGDIWASQSSNGQNVHCASQGLTFNLTNPIIAGFKVCSNPRTFSYGITNNGTSAITVFYRVYFDDGDGIFEPQAGDGSAVSTGTQVTINPGQVFSQSQVSYPGNNAPGEANDLWFEVVLTGSNFTTVSLFEHPGGCATLPVNFISFNAVRNRSNIVLSWSTLTEENNLGFEVQRKRGNYDWEPVSFIASKAVNGNSSTRLDYTFADVNSFEGISLYRLKQEDIDGKIAYSAIRAVRSEVQKGKVIIYPNPGYEGKVNIIFDNSSGLRDVFIADMNGRIVREWKGITDNNLEVNNLVSGFYIVRIINRETGQVFSEKIVITRR